MKKTRAMIFAAIALTALFGGLTIAAFAQHRPWETLGFSFGTALFGVLTLASLDARIPDVPRSSFR